MRNLYGRLGRLERTLLPPRGRCPACPTIGLVTVDADGRVVEGADPEPCPRCGGAHDGGVRCVVVELPPEPPQGEVPSI